MNYRQRASGLWVPEDRRICRLDRDRDRDRDGASVRAAGGGGGGGGVLIDFSGIEDVSPFVPSAQGFTEDDSNGNKASVVSGRWKVGTSGNDEQTMHANIGTLDLNGEADVYAELQDVRVGTNSLYATTALALMADYSPGAWSPLSNGGTINGYRAQFAHNRVMIHRLSNGTGTALLDDNTVTEIVNGVDLRLRAVVGESAVTISVLVNGVEVRTVEDTSASRFTNFRTIGVSVIQRATTSDDWAAGGDVIDGGAS